MLSVVRSDLIGTQQPAGWIKFFHPFSGTPDLRNFGMWYTVRHIGFGFRKGRDPMSTFSSRKICSSGMSCRPSERIWTFVFLDIIMLSMIVSIVCHALYGALPLYVESLGGKAAFSGLLTAVFALAAGVGRILTGALSARYGCRIVLIFGGILMTLANFVPLILPGLGILLAVRFFQGVGFSGVSTASANASAEVLPRSRLGEGMGYYGLGQSFAMVIGPSLGYALFHFGQSSAWGNHVIWYGMAGLSLILIILAWVCRYTPNLEEETDSPIAKTKNVPQMQDSAPHVSIWRRITNSFFEPGALSMAFVCGLFMFSCSFYSSFLMLFAQRNEIEKPQLFFLGTALAMFAVRLFAGKLGDRFPPVRVLMPTLGVGVLSFFLTSQANSAAMLFVSGTLYGISVGLGFPFLNTMAYRLTTPSRWHASTATFFLGCDIGWASGSYAWGVVIDEFGFTCALSASGLLVFITALSAAAVLWKQTAPNLGKS